jgi:hypothetical protein
MKIALIGNSIYADSLPIAELNGRYPEVERLLEPEIDDNTDDLECEIGELQEQLSRAGETASGWAEDMGTAIDCLGVNAEKFTKAEIIDSIKEAKAILEKAQREMEKKSKKWSCE